PAWKAPVYLNRLREARYRELFERTSALDIVEWPTEFTEGEDLVNEVIGELPDYSREELTKRSIIVVLRKRERSMLAGGTRRGEKGDRQGKFLLGWYGLRGQRPNRFLHNLDLEVWTQVLQLVLDLR